MVLALTIAAVLVSSAAAVYHENGPTGPVPGKFIVKLKPGVRSDLLAKSLSASANPITSPFGEAVVGGSSQAVGSPTKKPPR